jgi:hypothetical protein
MNNKSIFELLFKTVTQSCDTVKLAGGMSDTVTLIYMSFIYVL